MYTYYFSSSSSPSFSLLKGASRFRFPSSPSKPSSISKIPPSSVSFSNQKLLSLSFSSALRCISRSTAPWSHGVDWRSPPSLRLQARVAAPRSPPAQSFSTMPSEHAYKRILTSLPKPEGGEFGKFYSLPALNDPRIDRLPYSIRILLESAIRNCDNFEVTKDDVEKISDWENTSLKQVEIPFKPARVLLT